MPDLVDYLRDRLKAATDPVCGCPDIDVSTLREKAQRVVRTVKGYNMDCPIHGLNGTAPTRRRIQ